MVETPGHRPLPLYTPQGPARGAVLIVPSWWGLTASFPHYARLLAREGFAVLISDLFGGGTARTEAEARA
jgi:dienelactone hydrolase